MKDMVKTTQKSYRVNVIKDGTVSKGLYYIEYKAKLGCWAMASTRLFFTKDSATRYLVQLQQNNQ